MSTQNDEVTRSVFAAEPDNSKTTINEDKFPSDVEWVDVTGVVEIANWVPGGHKVEIYSADDKLTPDELVVLTNDAVRFTDWAKFNAMRNGTEFELQVNAEWLEDNALI